MSAPLPREEQLTAWVHRLANDEQTLKTLRDERGWSADALVQLRVGLDDSGRLVFPIRDEDDKLVGIVTRDGRGRGSKTPSGHKRGLFPAPEEAHGDVVFVVEGEADAVAAATIGLPVVSMPGTARMTDEYAARIASRRKRVVVIPDADEPGRKAAGQWAAALAAAGCPDVRVIDLGELELANVCDLNDALLHVRGHRGLADVIRGMADAAEPVHSGSTIAEVDVEPLAAVPDYPIAVLPEVARTLVRDGAAQGLPAALLGGSVLAALAAAIGGAAQIKVTPAWHERAILWVANVAPRGAGKSPAQELAFAPLRAHDAALDDDAAGNGVLLDDQTLEALARELHGAGGAAALDLDELSVLLRGFGEYKGGSAADRGRFLKLWTGAPWIFTRVAGGAKTNGLRLSIARPTLVICGGLQPALHDLLGSDEDGLRPRWLPHFAEMPLDPGELGNARPSSAWRDLLRRLLADRGVERTWTLNRSARAAFEHHRRLWKSQARGVETASVSAALGKADMHLARVALVLAEAESSSAGGGVVGADVIERAAYIITFTLDCWRALPEQGSMALSHRDRVLDGGVDQLLAWLDEHGGQASRRDLQRAHVGRTRTASDLDALLARYEATFPGTVTEERRSGPPTVIVQSPKRRRTSSAVTVATGDSDIRSDQNVSKHGDSGTVANGDSAVGDSAAGDSAAANGSAATPRVSALTADMGDGGNDDGEGHREAL